MDSEKEFNILCGKLCTLEPIINEMLSLKPPPAILKEKLTQLKQLVLQIPDNYSHVQNEWRRKLDMWNLSCGASTSDQPSSSAMMKIEASTDKSVNPQPEFQNDDYYASDNKQLVTYTPVESLNNGHTQQSLSPKMDRFSKKKSRPSYYNDYNTY